MCLIVTCCREPRKDTADAHLFITRVGRHGCCPCNHCETEMVGTNVIICPSYVERGGDSYVGCYTEANKEMGRKGTDNPDTEVVDCNGDRSESHTTCSPDRYSKE